MRGLVAFVTTVVTVAMLAAHPAAASTTGACDGTNLLTDHVVVGADGATLTTNTKLDGVSGDIYVPNWTTTNLRGQATSASDVIFNIEDSAKHFFQLGWYLGEADGLPEATTPRVFFGEGVVSPTIDEDLVAINGVPLSLGRYHNFRIQRISDPDPAFNWHYAAYVNGAQVWTSQRSSTIEGTPSVVGETNWRCADLYLRASTVLGEPALKGHRSGGSWSLWQQHLDVYLYAAEIDPQCWYVSRVDGHTATSHAYDVC